MTTEQAKITALKTLLSDGHDRTMGQLIAVTGWSVRDLTRMLGRLTHRERTDPFTGARRYGMEAQR